MAIETAAAAAGSTEGGSVACLLLESGFDSMAALAQHHYPYLPAKWLIKDRYESVLRMRQLDLPALMMHGRQGRIVPLKFAEALAAAAQRRPQLQIFDAAGHNDLYDHGAAEHAIAFIESNCRR